MSNNQKAVKYNPSNSKNDIGVALLRNRTKVFVKKQILAFRQFFRVSRGLITYPMPISCHDMVQIPDYPRFESGLYGFLRNDQKLRMKVLGDIYFRMPLDVSHWASSDLSNTSELWVMVPYQPGAGDQNYLTTKRSSLSRFIRYFSRAYFSSIAGSDLSWSSSLRTVNICDS